MSEARDMAQQEAADWFALKRSGQMTAQELVDFQQWLAAAPQNRAAWEEAEASWAMAGLLRDDPQMMLLRGEARRTYPPFRRAFAIGGAVAAAVVALVAIAPAALDHRPAIGEAQQTFRTGVGQRTTVTLTDGSIVTLDTDTILRTREGGHERRMYLDRGRAFFKVAKDPSRPFVVSAAGRTVTALGTAFDVDVSDGEFEVTLAEGRVRVEQPRLLRPSQVAELKAGYQVEATGPREWVVKPADVARDTGWIEGRLTFVDEPLIKVAAEMNRYSEKKIVVRDADVGKQPVVAVFKPGDMEAFVKMVRSYGLAEVSETESAIQLTAISPPQQ